MMNRKRAYWLCQVAGWSLYAAAGMAIGFAFMSFSWRYAAAVLINVSMGLALTHAWRWWMRRRNWLRLSLWALVPRVVLTSAALAVVWLCFSIVASHLISKLSSIPAEARGAVAMATWFN